MEEMLDVIGHWLEFPSYFGASMYDVYTFFVTSKKSTRNIMIFESKKDRTKSEKPGLDFVDKIEASNGQNFRAFVTLSNGSSTSHVIPLAMDNAKRKSPSG
ncbi:hypothetical protein GOBAR_DD11837 [Gossypium barbadense]|nr:hypothetical protein GOBAR_DD11837 [Gossypium barbadense]